MIDERHRGQPQIAAADLCICPDVCIIMYQRGSRQASRAEARAVVNLDWPANVIRTKGVLYFSHNRDMSLLFEQAGIQKNLKEAGYWYATAPEEELTVLMEREPGLRRDWDEEYGDRMIKLVFIGRDLDRTVMMMVFLFFCGFLDFLDPGGGCRHILEIKHTCVDDFTEVHIAIIAFHNSCLGL